MQGRNLAQLSQCGCGLSRRPSGASEITAEEAHELAVIFGKGGELAAELLS